jgi:hypothetical protein
MPEDMDDTPVGSLGVAEHLVGPVVRNGLGRPFVLTGNTGPRRILEKILDIVARAERISRAVPKTTCMFSSCATSLKIRARATYMADVIAFRLVGRFSCTRKMLPTSL